MNADQLFEEFIKSKPKDKGAGPGKKQCPKCKTHVGVRLQVCECGHEFVKGGKKRDPENEVTEEDRLYAMSIGSPGGRLVYAGGGSTSARLSDIDFQSVSDYCNLVVNEGISQRLIYTTSAIKKFIQHQFGYNSEEYKQAVAFVDMWYDDKMFGIDIPSGVEYNVE